MSGALGALGALNRLQSFFSTTREPDLEMGEGVQADQVGTLQVHESSRSVIFFSNKSKCFDISLLVVGAVTGIFGLLSGHNFVMILGSVTVLIAGAKVYGSHIIDEDRKTVIRDYNFTVGLEGAADAVGDAADRVDKETDELVVASDAVEGAAVKVDKETDELVVASDKLQEQIESMESRISDREAKLQEQEAEIASKRQELEGFQKQALEGSKEREQQFSKMLCTINAKEEALQKERADFNVYVAEQRAGIDNERKSLASQREQFAALQQTVFADLMNRQQPGQQTAATVK